MGSKLRSTKSLRSIVIILLFSWLAVSIMSCSPDPDFESNKTTLNRGLSGEPESLDPHGFTSNQSETILRDIGEGLLTYSAGGQLVPGIAERWEISDDNLILTFHLRPQARWSNGSPVTASDFEFAFRRLVNSHTASPYAEFVSAIHNASDIVKGVISPEQLGVLAVDSHTLQIRLHTQTPHFLQLLSHPSTFPVHEASFRKIGTDLFSPGSYVSNGAYILTDWSIGSAISLRQNNAYWGNDKTYINTVVYHVVDQNVEFDRYRAGEIDVTANVPEAVFSKVRVQTPTELRVSPYLGIYYYGFNMTKDPFSNNHYLRQALSLAIDRQVLVDKITGRGEVPAYSWVPPGVNMHEQQKSEYSILGKEARETEARRLFAQAGLGIDDEFVFELRYNTFDGHHRIALAIQSMWRNVLGVNAILVNEEFKVFIDSVRSKENTEVFRLSWTGDYNDALSFLQIMKTDNPSNLTGYSNPEFDQLISLAESAADPVVRKSLLEKAERIAMADYPVVPLYFYVSKHLVDPAVIGWEDNVMDIHLSRYLSFGETPNSR